MGERIGELLARRAASKMVGRREELAWLLNCLEASGPLIVWLHGIAGIGKSTLLQAFAAAARERGAAVRLLDCRLAEPTESGVLGALGAAIGEPLREPGKAGAAISSLGAQVIILLDHYEVFRLVDAWIRQRLLPALAAHVRVVIACREPPSAAWAAGVFADLFGARSLGGLDSGDAVALLVQSGINPEVAGAIAAWTNGHPLALRLAAATAGTQGHPERAGAPLPGVLKELTHIYLEEVPDPHVRHALEAMAAVRRATRPMLAALCPEAPPEMLYDRLVALHFVELRSDGLALHEAIRDIIRAALKAADAPQLRRHQRIAWKLLRSELRSMPPGELWRWTADAIYLIENPVIREAFFPSCSTSYVVEPAGHDDGDGILAIAGRHDAEPASGWLSAWWESSPDSFHVIRDAHCGLAGFYCMARSSRVDPAWLQRDPVAWCWWRHLQDAPRAHRRDALFLRRWLSAEHGEAPGPVQAAAWLDIKRSYLELRPGLRRVYLCLRNPAPYAAVARELGFRMIEEADLPGEHAIHSALLDFGPGSVDGWICELVQRELEIDGDDLLDVRARQLVVEGRRIDLTPLEFGTLNLLQLRSGEAVPRGALLDEVWGRDCESGSNVVDTVVRSLRRKLRAHAGRIETVHGVGYRYRPDLPAKADHAI